MKQKLYEVIENDGSLEIKLINQRALIIVLIFTAFLAIVSTLLGFISIINLIANDFKVGFGFIILTAIEFIVGIFLIRVFLWNAYGTEKYVISKEHVAHYFDYKYFKDNKQTLPTNNMISGFVPSKSDDKKNEWGTIFLERENEKIQSSIELPNADIEILLQKIRLIGGIK